jgi:GTPase SAR1 family protein
MRYAVLVTGPAGAGKSTFCASFMTHLQTSKRSGHLVNLDPAAAPDSFEYAPSIDIKDLISVDDAMSELGYGPNGGLVYCFEYVSAPFALPERRGRAFSGERRYLLQNMDWFEEEVGEYEDDYLIIDCPGMPRVLAFAPVFFFFAMP